MLTRATSNNRMLTHATSADLSKTGEVDMKFRMQTVARPLFAVLLVMCALMEGVWCAAQATGQTAASSQPVLLKEGIEMKLKLQEKVTSKTAVEGDQANLVLDQDLKVGAITVARAGSVVVASVSHAGEAGMLG